MMMQGGVPQKQYDPEQMKMGIKEESEEHPWLTQGQVKRLVKDHLDISADYYTEEEEAEEHEETESTAEKGAEEKAGEKEGEEE